MATYIPVNKTKRHRYTTENEKGRSKICSRYTYSRSSNSKESIHYCQRHRRRHYRLTSCPAPSSPQRPSSYLPSSVYALVHACLQLVCPFPLANVSSIYLPSLLNLCYSLMTYLTDLLPSHSTFFVIHAFFPLPSLSSACSPILIFFYK